MAVTVGTDSYLTLAEFKAQADALARDYSSYTDAQIEAALIESSLYYIDVTFEFKGAKLVDTQPMALPTTEVEIPDISKGAFQAAWQSLTGTLFINPADANKSNITKERKKLGTLETEVVYSDGATTGYTYDTTRIELLLKPYLDVSTLAGSGFMVVKGVS
jgi:hypothetical protein